MNKVGIIGLGLLGGSIALALKSKTLDVYIVASDKSEESLKKAFRDGAIDEYSTYIDEIFKECSIIFVCTAVHTIVENIKAVSKIAPRDCIITDVGSTKAEIFDELSYFDVCYIGGHPMTGSEKTGYQNAKEYLFENAYYVLTIKENTPHEKIEYIKNIIKKIGAIPIAMDAKKHDFVVSAISHVPHIVASALVNTVENLDDDDKFMYQLAAGGFKDITRIASGSPEIWCSISKANRNEILKTVRKFKNNIENFENSLLQNNTDEIYNFFNEAKNYRDTFSGSKIMSVNRMYDVLVDIVDKPGSIACITDLLSKNNINIKNIGIINNREYQDGVLQILFDNESDMEKCIHILKEVVNYD